MSVFPTKTVWRKMIRGAININLSNITVPFTQKKILCQKTSRQQTTTAGRWGNSYSKMVGKVLTMTTSEKKKSNLCTILYFKSKYTYLKTFRSQFKSRTYSFENLYFHAVLPTLVFWRSKVLQFQLETFKQKMVIFQTIFIISYFLHSWQHCNLPTIPDKVSNSVDPVTLSIEKQSST